MSFNNIFFLENIIIMQEYFLYIVLTIIIIILLICGYIKIKHRFWSMQPVYHIYDFHYYLFPPGIINYELPEKNQYCNFTNIEFISYDKLSDLKLTQFQHIIQSHYLQNNENKYEPQKENIIPYFIGHNVASFFSFYYEDELLTDLKKGTIDVPNKKLVGVMTTRPLHVTINNGGKHAFFDCNYVDHLCVNNMHRKKGIAQQLIQTHHYHQRHKLKQIQVSLFKREGELTGIVPLTVYDTFGFNMSGWIEPQELPANEATLIECGPTNIQHLVDFMKENKSRFDICIVPEISNILELMKTKNVYVYMVIHDQEVKSAYFFRKTCTFITANCEALCCFASINGFHNNNNNTELFIHSYKLALWKISESNKNYKYAIIENISDNKPIIDNLKLKTVPCIINPTAYFFYNFAYPTFNHERVFIIN